MQATRVLDQSVSAGRSADVSRLVLGTAQFGLPYGVVSPRKPVAQAEIAEILALAWAQGIDTLDTAPAYGAAEQMIAIACPHAARFAIISKTPAICRDRLIAADIERISAAARRSREATGVNALDTLLVHHAPDLLVPGGDDLYDALMVLRAAAVTRRLGVSVYDLATLEAVLAKFPIEVVQLPLNLLDQRFVRSGTITELSRRGIEVHVRSVFLQGILLGDPARLPARFSAVRGTIAQLHAEAAACGLSPVAAALDFAASCPGVSRIVIGVDDAAHLRANLRAFGEGPAAARRPDPDSFAIDDPDIVDPRRWAS